MSKKNSSVIGAIILGGHIQALGIMRILGRMGIKCIIIDDTSICVSKHSKYCNKFYKVDNTGLLDYLRILGESKKYYKWIIFPTNDYHVKTLSINRFELEAFFTVSTDYWSKVSLFYNKKHTYEIANRIGIPIPKSYYPKNSEDLKKIDISFPCIIKPAVMHDFYKQTKKKVYLCKNITDLNKYYLIAQTIIPKEEIIIQEVISGPSKNQYSACFLFIKGTCYVSLTANRMRQHPLDFGNATTYAETVNIPLLIDYSMRILREVDYNGLCEVEFKLDENDGIYKFLEVNPRTWKWHSIANKSDSPFLPLFYSFLIGENINPVNNTKPACFRHFITDFPIQLKLFIKGFDYAFRIKGSKEKAIWAFDDIKPAIFEFLYLPILIFKR